MGDQSALNSGLASIEIQKARSKAEIEVWKNQMKISQELAAENARAEILANVGSKRELQKLDVDIEENGQITIKKEAFGGEIRGHCKFSILENRFLQYWISGEQRRILLVKILDQSGMVKEIGFFVQEFDERLLNKKFSAAGICFGFSQEKETRVRRMLYTKLIQTTKPEIIPPVRSWYEVNGKICFAFPEERFVGEEVEKHVR